MKQKAIVRVYIVDKKSLKKAMKTAVGLSGVISACLQKEDKNLIEVVGERYFNSVVLIKLLRKCLGLACLQEKDKNLIEVVGEGIDSVVLTKLLRKRLGFAELMSVNPIPVPDKKEKEGGGGDNDETKNKEVISLSQLISNDVFYDPGDSSFANSEESFYEINEEG